LECNYIRLKCTYSQVLGIKGFSIISKYLDYFDVVKDVDLDCMHGFALNIVKHLLKLWFSEEHKEKPFSLHSNLEIANFVTINFKFPHINTRTTRLLENFDDWKASELQNWMLLIAKPLLKRLMTAEYFHHTCLLIDGFTMLLQRFSYNTLLIAKDKVILNYYVILHSQDIQLYKWYEDLETLYDKRYCLIYEHQIGIHLWKTCKW
jgi:hypothetical protein